MARIRDHASSRAGRLKAGVPSQKNACAVAITSGTGGPGCFTQGSGQSTIRMPYCKLPTIPTRRSSPTFRRVGDSAER